MKLLLERLLPWRKHAMIFLIMSVLELQRISAEFPPQDKHSSLSICRSIILSDILFLFATMKNVLWLPLREAPRNISRRENSSESGRKIERIKRDFRIARPQQFEVEIFGFQIHHTICMETAWTNKTVVENRRINGKIKAMSDLRKKLFY